MKNFVLKIKPISDETTFFLSLTMMALTAYFLWAANFCIAIQRVAQADVWMGASILPLTAIFGVWVDWRRTFSGIAPHIRRWAATFTASCIVFSASAQFHCERKHWVSDGFAEKIGIIPAQNVIYQADQVFIFGTDSLGNPVRSFHLSITNRIAMISSDSAFGYYNVHVWQRTKDRIEVSCVQGGWECEVSITEGWVQFRPTPNPKMRKYNIGPPKRKIAKLLWYSACPEAPYEGVAMTKTGEVRWYAWSLPGSLPASLVHPSTLLMVVFEGA